MLSTSRTAATNICLYRATLHSYASLSKAKSHLLSAATHQGQLSLSYDAFLRLQSTLKWHFCFKTLLKDPF